MSMVLPFECDYESDCAEYGKDPNCANRDACDMPESPECEEES